MKCLKCLIDKPLDEFNEIFYNPSPGVRRVYRRHTCKECIREEKAVRYKELSFQEREERRAIQRMCADDKRRIEGKSVRRTRNHLL